MLGRQLKARMSVCDYTLHLLAGQGSPYLQYDRQRNDEVPVGIVRSRINFSLTTQHHNAFARSDCLHARAVSLP